MKKENELISIIVPVYNVEQYISDCVKSIVNQTYKELEIILVNDGSTDQSYNICNSYASKDKRIKILNIENSGVSNARNRGLDIAQGQYVTFVDSDDTIEKDYVEILYRTLKKYDADCVNAATNYVYETKNKKNIIENNSEFSVRVLNRSESINAICYLEQIFPSYDMAAVWGCLYKKSLIEDIRFNTHVKIGEDFLFKFTVFQNVNKVACIKRPCYNYLLRKDSAMRTGYDARKVDSIRALEKEIENIDDEYKSGYISRIVNIAIVVLFMIPIDRKYFSERKYVSEFIKKNRNTVLKNPKTRKKVKIALITSYIGFNNLQRTFSFLTRLIRQS